VLADSAELPAEVDRARAERARDRASALSGRGGEDVDYARAAAALAARWFACRWSRARTERLPAAQRSGHRAHCARQSPAGASVKPPPNPPPAMVRGLR